MSELAGAWPRALEPGVCDPWCKHGFQSVCAGVAEPCLSIHQNEKYAYEYTAKGHLIGVITNGTAVLGLGNIGALAGRPPRVYVGITVMDLGFRV